MEASRLETDTLIKQMTWMAAAAEIGFGDDFTTARCSQSCRGEMVVMDVQTNMGLELQEKLEN